MESCIRTPVVFSFASALLTPAGSAETSWPPRARAHTPAREAEQSARAVLALGGLQDVCMQFPDAPVEELKAAAVAGALAALGR